MTRDTSIVATVLVILFLARLAADERTVAEVAPSRETAPSGGGAARRERAPADDPAPPERGT